MTRNLGPVQKASASPLDREPRRLQAAFRISKRDLRRLRDRSIRAQGRDQSEVCGVVLLQRSGYLHLVFLQNQSDSPLQFEISQSDMRKERQRASAHDLRLIGTFHSHPIGYAIPGATDLSLRHGRFQLIYDVCGRRARLWRITRRNGSAIAHEIAFTVDSGR